MVLWKIRTDTSIAIDENIILETIPIFAPTAEDSAVSLLRKKKKKCELIM